MTIKEARIKAKLTQSETAKRVSISRRALQYLESGVQDPSLGTAYRLSKLLGISMEEIAESTVENLNSQPHQPLQAGE